MVIIFFLIGLVATGAVVVACYAVIGFFEASQQEAQDQKERAQSLEKENARLRFENKRRQLIINRLEEEFKSSHQIGKR